MENESFFDIIKNKKIVATKTKAKKQIISLYIVIVLIPFVIYRTAHIIIDDEYIKMLNHFETIITSMSQYKKVIMSQAYTIIGISIFMILCNFIVSVFDSFIFFNKHYIKKEDKNSLIKIIAIMQIIFAIILAFFFIIDYSNDYTGIQVDRYRLEKLLETNNNEILNNQGNEIVDTYIKQIENIYLVKFIIIFITHVIFIIMNLILQVKMIEANSE